MATVRRHQTEAAIAGFSQVVGLTWVHGHFSRRCRFIALAGAQVSPLGLVGGRVQREGVGFAVCAVWKVVLQGRAGLAAAHAVHLYQHGCLRPRWWLPSLRSIPEKEE